MMTKDIENVLMQGSIAELRALYVEKRLSVADAVSWYLSRIDAISQKGPAINAVREVSLRAMDDAKRADEAIARGEDLQALHGIPVLLKDNILTGDGMKAAAGAAAGAAAAGAGAGAGAGAAVGATNGPGFTQAAGAGAPAFLYLLATSFCDLQS